MMKSTIFAIAAFMAATSIQAQSLADVLGSVERNNTELKAMLKGNEAILRRAA